MKKIYKTGKIFLLVGILLSALGYGLIEYADNYIMQDYVEWDGQDVSTVKAIKVSHHEARAMVASGKIIEPNQKYYAQVYASYSDFWLEMLGRLFAFTGCVPQQPGNPPLPNQPAQEVDWGYTKIQALDANKITVGAGKKVCILDTGIDKLHPDLKFVGGRAFEGSRDFNDTFGHGTHVAGIIAALSNSIGVVGPTAADLYIGKVLTDDGSGTLEGIAQGIHWCISQGVDAINMSLGGGGDSAIMRTAIQDAYSYGISVFMANGNDSGPVNYPAKYAADYPNKIYAISATDRNDVIANFSSRGPETKYAAPGVGIYSTVPVNCKICRGASNYEIMSGTSMATPYALAVGVLALSSGKEIGVDILTDSSLYGKGRVNALKSVR